MIMKKAIIVLGAFIGLFFTSCGKMLVITPPNAIIDEQVNELLAQGGETAEQVINNFASPMPSYFDLTNIGIGSGSANPTTNSMQGINFMRGLEGNDVAWGCSDCTNQDEYRGVKIYWMDPIDRNPKATASQSHWYGYALGINKANLLLKYVDALDKTTTLYKTASAKGLLVRAFSYHSLMEEYAPAYCNMIDPKAENSGMSLYTEYNPSQEAKPRDNAENTYKMILSDINTAITNLKSAGVGFTHEDGELEDLDLGVANFLKARVGLFIGGKSIDGKTGWDICKEACEELINKGGYNFIEPNNWGSRKDSYLPENNAFLCIRKNVNPEVILGFIMGSTNTDGSKYGNALNNIFGGYAEGYLFARINNVLYDKIDDNDIRKAAFSKESLGTLTYGGGGTTTTPTYCNLKFAGQYGLDPSGAGHTTADKATDNEFVKFRLSEVYLMYAEALLNTNGDATKPIDALLAKRGTGLSCANYKGQSWTSKMQEFIQLQWSIEMWGESGREYFNNKRWKVNVDRTSEVHKDAMRGHTPGWSGKWQDMTLEFPENEQLYNKNYAADAVNTPSALK